MSNRLNGISLGLALSQSWASCPSQLPSKFAAQILREALVVVALIKNLNSVALVKRLHTRSHTTKPAGTVVKQSGKDVIPSAF